VIGEGQVGVEDLAIITGDDAMFLECKGVA